MFISSFAVVTLRDITQLLLCWVLERSYSTTLLYCCDLDQIYQLKERNTRNITYCGSPLTNARVKYKILWLCSDQSWGKCCVCVCAMLASGRCEWSVKLGCTPPHPPQIIGPVFDSKEKLWNEDGQELHVTMLHNHINYSAGIRCETSASFLFSLLFCFL